ncbi:small membrane protein [Neobacillus bataviensis LMG 21833]|uniref:Small membrane protein n=1 Tax=Neobacillus bataviensis LMG 21833 TaxID=1117379 RepID=K6CJI8_9BACI|nr:hypothetical protein [Neobacillus bataviensis]EKN71335.1 small membrane protein [Neobacillus bataviensis LMG 21833]
MEKIIELIALIVNNIHDFILALTSWFGYQFSDKDLHFWVIGIIGIVIFLFTQFIFKIIAKWSITAISFIYTFTVLLVIVFAIEIEQKITGRGNMEFKDIVVGLYGFLLFLFIYLAIKFAITFLYKKTKKKTRPERWSR